MTDTLADKMHTALMAERPLLRARQADICADVATDYYAELVAAAQACAGCVKADYSRSHKALEAALAAIEHPEAGR